MLSETVESGERAAVSDLVLSETYFALQHHYEVPKKEAIEALRIASASGELICSENAKRILSQKDLHRAKPGFVDRLIHAEYASRNRHMITFEKSARKLEGALVL